MPRPPDKFREFVEQAPGIDGRKVLVKLREHARLGPVPDFWIEATPESQSAQRGSSAIHTVFVRSGIGFVDGVGLSVAHVPDGAAAWFDAEAITCPGTTRLRVTQGPSTETWGYRVTITGTSGTLEHRTRSGSRWTGRGRTAR